jgi:flagellar biosynthesis protein FlhF
MNVQRFCARSSREALSLVRQALGDDAVVLSTKPSPGGGVEVLAMAGDGIRQVERLASAAPLVSAHEPAAAKAAKAEPAPVEEDVAKLSMSTLSFQDYVRERLLRRRQNALNAREGRAAQTPAADEHAAAAEPGVLQQRMSEAQVSEQRISEQRLAEQRAAEERLAEERRARQRLEEQRLEEQRLEQRRVEERRLEERRLEEQRAADERAAARRVRAPEPAPAAAAYARREQDDMLNELRAMKGLIEERFGALAFMEKLQRHPVHARMTQKLLECGFSPALIRKLGEGLPADLADDAAWTAGVLERNLATGEGEPALEDQGGVYALIGATGVGKTTSTAKIAAAFAAKHGASNLGLITLDAYRLGAHEQLRAYGRILGVPVHTAHDRASLEDLLDLLGGKKMVLIDTAGMAQRDVRTRELMEMLGHRAIRRLLVVNAASQGETIEDVMISYHAASCAGVVLSKVDEAVKLGPALDALIRHRLKVVGVANGQRVPEDWHRLSSNALVHRALRGGGSKAYRLDAGDVSLVFAAPQSAPAAPFVPPRAPAAAAALHA